VIGRLAPALKPATKSTTLLAGCLFFTFSLYSNHAFLIISNGTFIVFLLYIVVTMVIYSVNMVKSILLQFLFRHMNRFQFLF